MDPERPRRWPQIAVLVGVALVGFVSGRLSGDSDRAEESPLPAAVVVEVGAASDRDVVGQVVPVADADPAVGAVLAAAEFSVTHGELLSMLPIARSDLARSIVTREVAGEFDTAVSSLAAELADHLGVMASWELATAEAPLRVDLVETTGTDAAVVRVWSVLVVSAPEAGSHQIWRTWTISLDRSAGEWLVTDADAEWGPSPMTSSLFPGATDHGSLSEVLAGQRPWSADLAGQG